MALSIGIKAFRPVSDSEKESHQAQLTNDFIIKTRLD